MKLNKLLDLIGLNENNKSQVDDEIDKIIKRNRFDESGRYNTLYKMLGVDKLNRDTKSEITSKLDEILTKERFKMLDNNLYEMYYPKKEKSNNVEKISKDEFKWVGNHSRGLKESSEFNNSFWMNGKKVFIDENDVVKYSQTHLTSIGDKLTPQQKEYLSQMGIKFVLHKSGD